MASSARSGANLGFSRSADGELRVQNRGQYLTEPHGGQFVRLPQWLAMHGGGIGDVLLEHADRGLMLFGEWCAARHSLNYTRLPDSSCCSTRLKRPPAASGAAPAATRSPRS